LNIIDGQRAKKNGKRLIKVFLHGVSLPFFEEKTLKCHCLPDFCHGMKELPAAPAAHFIIYPHASQPHFSVAIRPMALFFPVMGCLKMSN